MPDDQGDYSRWPAAAIREFPEALECFVLMGAVDFFYCES
jgi:hypothetical protein